ncbi:Asp/Glu racemase [Leekyejoonella antrihumi]|uniref:Asp/Glu racemase n=2 Tax=Leekyejoonella antrihumi TaxID=1660198 RepID=A0A563DSM9_9MICO|nr:Asp/Glu racemase [Leekyejoonella antrihumi]
MIVPSSNTCLEPMTYRILGTRDDVTVHSARIPVTRIALDSGSDHQFSAESMRQAAELLATADVDVIAWNGTSGSWLGAEHDQDITAVIAQATGVPATTSTLAYFDAFERFAIQSVGLLTPYTTDVNQRVAARYGARGIHVVADHAIGLSDNESFARVTPDELLQPSRELIEYAPDALIYLCTNLYGAPAVQPVEAESQVAALDSVAVTLWHCLTIIDAPLLDRRWGRLLT